MVNTGEQDKVVRVLVGVGGHNVWSTGVGSKISQDKVVRVLVGVGGHIVWSRGKQDKAI